MKYPVLLLCGIMLLANINAKAQSFTVAHDTVTITTTGAELMQFPDSVNNISSATVHLGWEVIATDFPADWQMAAGFCDPNLCYTFSWSWPATTPREFWFNPGSETYFLAIDFHSTSSMGCYYVRVRMRNMDIPTDTAIETFIVCKTFPADIDKVSVADKIEMYPNPAINELKIDHNYGPDINSIGIYDITGRLIATYAAATTPTILNLNGIRPGLYCLRLMNGYGATVVTRTFQVKY